MALFLDRRSGLPVTSKLKEVFPPNAPTSECPIYVLDESDSDDGITVYGDGCESDSGQELFVDAVEDLGELRTVSLPDELLDEVLRATQEDGEDQATLRAASLVSRDWSLPARRLLFSQSLLLTNAETVKRLRAVFDTHPELARAARQVDLSNPGGSWQDGRVADVFRRAAGLLRTTMNVSEFTMLHVALGDKVRTKLFSALKHLPVRSASIYSSSWTQWGRNGAIRSFRGSNPDMAELAHTLCAWRHLERLTLSGYSSYPRLFGPHSTPIHSVPSYHLTDLTIISADLSGSTLLWLLGSSGTSLKRLNLAATTGLTKDVIAHLFSLVGGTLDTLLLSLDIDDLDPSSSADPLDNSLLSPLTALKSFNLSTDTLFADSVLETLVTLPSVQSISLCFPSFSHAVVMRALEAVRAKPGGLRCLTLDAWETATLWTEEERYQALKACEAKEVVLALNGLIKEDIEDDWYGDDVSATLALFEQPDQPRRGSRVRPIWR
ncbi:hypothetical protein JCM10213_001957 [Rhodosporidiobolus nylandii]